MRVFILVGQIMDAEHGRNEKRRLLNSSYELYAYLERNGMYE